MKIAKPIQNSHRKARSAMRPYNPTRRLFLTRAGAATLTPLLLDKIFIAKVFAGDDPSPSAEYEYRNQFQYKMICTSSPGASYSATSATSLQSGAGELKMGVHATGPGTGEVTTAAMREIKQFTWISSANLNSAGWAIMDWAAVNFAHPDDSEVNVPGVSATVSVHAASWESPSSTDVSKIQAPPPEYGVPEVTPDVTSLTRSESDGRLTLVANWGSYGWTYGAVYNAPTTLVLSNSNIGSWSPTPGAHEGKVSQLAAMWSFDVLSRNRSLYRKLPDGAWQITPAAPPADGGSADPAGWSEWQ